MKPRINLKFVLACVAGMLAVGAVHAQRSAPDQVEKINAGEVPFDVVVRDKRGRPVKDLQSADFEVYEDGVRQDLNSFRLVVPKGVANDDSPVRRGAEKTNQISDPRSPNPRTAAPGGAADPTITAVALVFDRLTPDARARAYKTALNYLADHVTKGELVGVFLTDLSLVVLQNYTDDLTLLEKAVTKAAEHSSSLYTSNNEQARAVRDQATSALGGPAPVKSTSGDIAAEVQMLQSQLRGLERWEELQRDQQGYATTRGLTTIAESLRPLPGRKAVLFFSEGIAVPPDVLESFRAVINSANRANVSFYTIDAAGLRAESKDAETKREITSRSNARMVQEGRDIEVQGSMMKGLERNEDLLRLNSDSSLGQLANQTGGFLITDTNDLKGKLQKVDEDLHTYYLMSYAPKNQNYDGHFRQIEVRVKRPGLTMQSRKGYYAIKGSYASPVLPYEVPALAMLSNESRPKSFPLHAAAFSFPERDQHGLVPVMVEASMSDFTWKVDNEKRIYRTDFSIVVLLKDKAGQVVEKLSNQYRLSGPLEKLNEAQRGRVLFYRTTDLPAGEYELEAVAYDAPTARSSVITGGVEVLPAEDDRLRLSSIVILKSADKAVAADQQVSNPFHVADLVLYPNTGESAHKTLKQLPFFFTLYPATGAKAAPLPKLLIELRQQQHTLAQIPGELSTPDDQGRIQYMAGLPLEKIPAGSYELRITVNDGLTTVTRSRYFLVED